jgi:hypothetical protein
MSAFRGSKAIQDVIERMKPLAEWYERFKPEVRELVVERTDYDLIARWPRAAHALDIEVTHNGSFWKRFQLAYDSGEGRYLKPPEPEQASIE